MAARTSNGGWWIPRNVSIASDRDTWCIFPGEEILLASPSFTSLARVTSTTIDVGLDNWWRYLRDQPCTTPHLDLVTQQTTPTGIQETGQPEVLAGWQIGESTGNFLMIYLSFTQSISWLLFPPTFVTLRADWMPNFNFWIQDQKSSESYLKITWKMLSRLDVNINVITQHCRFKKKFKHAFGSVRSSKGGGDSSRSSSVTRRLGSVTRRLSFDLGAVNLSPGPATNSIFSVCKKIKTPQHCSLPFLSATPSSRSQTLEAIFELTPWPLMGPQPRLVRCIPELQRYTDTMRCVVLAAELPGHLQIQLTQTLS